MLLPPGSEADVYFGAGRQTLKASWRLASRIIKAYMRKADRLLLLCHYIVANDMSIFCHALFICLLLFTVRHKVLLTLLHFPFIHSQCIAAPFTRGWRTLAIPVLRLPYEIPCVPERCSYNEISPLHYGGSCIASHRHTGAADTLFRPTYGGRRKGTRLNVKLLFSRSLQ